MAELKTKENDASVDDFINSIQDVQKRMDSKKLKTIFEELSGYPAKMWGSSIVGFGSYHYKYKTGSEGDWPIAAFSPRKNALTLYLISSYEFKDFADDLKQLGKHKTSKGCLYINKLADVDEKVLRYIIKQSVDRVKSGEVLL